MQSNKKKEPEKISSTICRVVWDWIIQIALWASAVLVLVLKTSQREYPLFLHQISIGFIGLMYIIYLTNGIFISRTFKMLLSQKTSITLQEAIQVLVQEKPELSFRVECYHFESHFQNSEIESNSIAVEQKEVRTTTFAEKETFPYYSSRDISGPLVLNGENIDKDQYYYINLSIKTDINFNDALTCYDYNKQKEIFLNKYQWKDVHMDFIERKHLPGCISEKMYKIQNKVPFCVIWQIYIVFLIFGLIELFKVYVKSFVLQCNHTIRKIISTREKLDDFKYESFNPKIVFHDQEIWFSDFHFLNKDFKLKANPETDEIRNAKQYECLIPSLHDMTRKKSGSEYSVSTFRHNSLECKETIPDYYERIIPDP